MKIVTSALISCLASLLLWLVPATTMAMPSAGSNELRIDSSFLIPGASITGYNHYSVSSGNSSDSESLFGFGFAYGRFLSDNVELGSSLTFLYMSASGPSITVPGVAPFLRAFVAIDGHAAFYAAAVVGLQYAMRGSSSGSSSSDVTMLSAGADVGLEFFLADSWSLRIGPTYRYVHESAGSGTQSASGSEQIIGLNWAIAGYF